MRRSVSQHILAFIVISACATAHAQSLIWTEGYSHEVVLTPLDGSSMCTFSSSGSQPRGIAIDPTTNAIYVSRGQLIFKYTGHSISSDYDSVFIAEYNVNDLEIDLDEGKLYWGEDWADGDVVTGRLQRSNLDFTGVETLAEEVRPLHIALDTANRHIYWTDDAKFNDRLLRLDMDGGTPVEIVRFADLADPNEYHRGRGLDIDFANDKLYWTMDSGGLYRANLDGSNPEFLHPFAIGGAIVVDSVRSRLVFGAWATDLFSWYEMPLNETTLTQLPLERPRIIIYDIQVSDADYDLRGDTNWDGELSTDDITRFVEILLADENIQCDLQRADVNADGATNGLDLSEFVACLLGNC